MSRVVGLDLSLTSTGIAGYNWTQALRPRKMNSWSRLRWIRDETMAIVAAAMPELIVVEGPSYGSIGRGQHERGGLWWVVTEILDDAGLPIAIAPPANLKKYATGYGGGPQADKDAVVREATKRFAWFEGGNDEADALWLSAMGFDHLGAPLIEMPKVNRTGLDKCEWPGAGIIPAGTTVDA